MLLIVCRFKVFKRVKLFFQIEVKKDMKENTNKNKLRKPSKYITQILSDNIRTFRKQKKISQEDLADMCNLHRTYIGAIERGERNVTLSTLEILSDALGVNISKLLIEKSIENDKKQ